MSIKSLERTAYPAVAQLLRYAEEALSLADDFDQPIHFCLRIVEVETRTGAGFNPEFLMERLVAVMATA